MNFYRNAVKGANEESAKLVNNIFNVFFIILTPLKVNNKLKSVILQVFIYLFLIIAEGLLQPYIY